LFFVLLQHITKAGWSVTVRRPAEAIAANALDWYQAHYSGPRFWDAVLAALSSELPNGIAIV
jgi:hypothetical protein